MKLLIYGAGDFSTTVAALARQCGHEVVGLIDDTGRNASALGNFDQVRASHPATEHGIALAIGYNNLAARWAAWERVQQAGYPCPALIHPRAYVADEASLGAGCFVMAGAHVDVYANVEAACVLWPLACVNHDTRVGANSFISPSATLCGFVRLGAHSFVGAGAVLVDHVELPPGSFVKAASLVKRTHPA